MNTLLKTFAACILAVTMVPVYADEPTVHIIIEPQKNENEVDSAAAWVHGIVHAMTVCGSLGIGGIMAVSGDPIAYVGFAFCCVWGEHRMNRLAYGMNEATREKAQYINRVITDGVLLTGVFIALGMAAHKYMTVTA